MRTCPDPTCPDVQHKTSLLSPHEPPFLAILSLIGIISVLLEQLSPFISDLIFDLPSNDSHSSSSSNPGYTTSSMVRYKEICSEIWYHQNNFKNLSNWLFLQKQERPIIYVVIVFSCLSVVSYASFKFSNLWLCYGLFVVLSLCRVLWYEWEKIVDMRREVLKKEWKREKDQSKTERRTKNESVL